MKSFKQKEASTARPYEKKLFFITVCIAILTLCSLTSFIAESHARRNFFLERPKLGIKLSYEAEKDEREGPVNSSIKYSSSYSEELTIQTKGWVYHPALLVYSLNLSPEWEQVRETNSGTDETNSFLSNYIVELDFLQYKPYSLSLDASRDTSEVRSSFAERTRSTIDTYTALFSLKYPMLPTVAGYTHQEGSQTGFFDSDYEQDQVSMIMRHEKYLGNSRLNLTYKDQESTIDDTLTETNHQSAEFSNLYDFETDDRLTLRSDASYEETDSTDLHIRRYSIYETVNIKHLENLVTEYNATYEKDNRFDKLFLDPSRTEIKSASFGLNHKLYNNLDTYFKIRSSESNNRAGRNSFHSTGINWNYSRDIPWGTMKTNVGYNYTIRDSKVSEEGASIQFFDEPITFTLSVNRITLLNDDVITVSIEISDDTVANGKGFIFTEGTDYTIRTSGNKTEILRTTGSNIPIGTIVYVHYRYIPNPAFDYELFSQNYVVNLQLFSSLSLYYGHARSNQDRLRGEPPDVLVDDTSHSAGGEYRWKWSRTSFDWEDNYTTQSPTREWNASEILTFTPFHRSFLQFSGSYGLSKFKDIGETERTRNVGAKFQMQLTTSSNMSLSGYIIDISGQTQDFTNSEVTSEYNLHYRIYRLTLRYVFRNDRDSDIDENFLNHYFLVELRRSLF